MKHPGPASQCVSYQTVLLGNRATPHSQAAGLTIFSHQRLGVLFFKVTQLEESALKKRICGTPDLTSFLMAQCPWMKHTSQFVGSPLAQAPGTSWERFVTQILGPSMVSICGSLFLYHEESFVNCRKSEVSLGRCLVIYSINVCGAQNIPLWRYPDNNCLGSIFSEIFTWENGKHVER